MTPEELLSKIEYLIKSKKTHPKLLTFVELRHNITGDKESLNKSFQELIRSGRIRVHRGMNVNLIEVCNLKQK